MKSAMHTLIQRRRTDTDIGAILNFAITSKDAVVKMQEHSIGRADAGVLSRGA